MRRNSRWAKEGGVETVALDRCYQADSCMALPSTPESDSQRSSRKARHPPGRNSPPYQTLCRRCPPQHECWSFLGPRRFSSPSQLTLWECTRFLASERNYGTEWVRPPL